MPFTSLLMSASLIAVYPAAVVAELIVFILGRVSKLFTRYESVANFQIVDNVNCTAGKLRDLYRFQLLLRLSITKSFTAWIDGETLS